MTNNNPMDGRANESLSATAENTPLPQTEGPLISVLVSTYNSERYLRGCLEDLQAQTIADRMEIIVIDSGSQQNEKAIVEELQELHNNIRYLRTERETLYAAWNRGIKMARGKYVANANADDSHRPDALDKLARALEAFPEAALAYGDYFTTAVPNDTFENPRILRRNAHPPHHPATAMFYCVTGCHPMWRRTVFDQVGMFDPSFTAPGDYEFVLRVVQAGLQAVHVPEMLSLFYQNPDGLSYNADSKANQEFKLIQAKYRSEMPVNRLFRVNPDNPREVSRGFLALGNLTMEFEVPWFDNPSQDLDYAMACYREALRLDAGNEAAAHNLIVAITLEGKLQPDDLLWQQMTPALADALRQSISQGRPRLMKIDLPPALESLSYGGKPQTTKDGSEATVQLSSSSLDLPVRWVAPFLNPSGNASEALDFVVPLAREIELGTLDQSEPYSEAFATHLTEADRSLLQSTRKRFPYLLGGIVVSQMPASKFHRWRGGGYHVGRTCFESDRLPKHWVNHCNQMDEIWVPSEFNRETFANSGVEADKLLVIPGAVDSARFDPDRHPPMSLPNRAGYNFLSVFEWSSRKGWDVLLAAYLREFSQDDDVCLYLRTAMPGQPEQDIRNTIPQIIQRHVQTLQLGDKRLPRIELLTDQVPLPELPGLYAASDCLLAPFRGEGWGRSIHEAMMMQRPVIATNWSGPTEYLTEENSYRLNFDLVEIKQVELELWSHRGHRWANPDEGHLRRLMRQVQQNPEEGRTKGNQARIDMTKRFSLEPVQEILTRRLQEIERKLTTPACPAVTARALSVEPELEGQEPQPIKVAWEGSFLDLGSLSHVNRELTSALSSQPNLALSCVCKNTLNDKLAQMPHLQETARRLKGPQKSQITVRHSWPPVWNPPTKGLWVLIQPWEYGTLPLTWVKEMAKVSELWVYSEHVRRTYVDSGVDPDQVKVVSLGIDPKVFKPEAPPLALATRKSFKFLFVGGTIHRKGPDVLLKAYLERFSAKDDVCLVIKDFGGKSVYAGQTFEEQIKEAQALPDAPEILYLTEELSPESLPGLYTACDCLVHPYRGEGFGLPVLEAMACGLPVVVTAGGATDDFADDHHAYRIPARRIPLNNKVGGFVLVHSGWLLEPSQEDLMEQMRWIIEHPAQAKTRGRAASDYVRREWTWENAARIVNQRLQNLLVRTEAGQAEKNRPRPQETTTRNKELPAVAKLGNLREAQALAQNKQWNEAWDATLEATRTRPFHPEAIMLLAEIARATGERNLAEDCVKHVRQMVPKWKQAQQSPKVTTEPGRDSMVPLAPLPDFIRTAQKSPRLTVCLITRNEQSHLRKCLESVRPIAWQIVVVDTGSTDQTPEIAREMGAEVSTFTWCDDFSAARNAALEQARGDWVLMLDADEVLRDSSRTVLQKEIQNAKVMGYRLPIIDVGQEAEGCNYVPRLFRNAPGLFYLGRVHEQVFTSLQALSSGWGMENKLGTGTLTHFGYSTEIMRERGKSARNLALLQKALEEVPEDPNLVMNLGLELMRAGHPQSGREHYLEAFDLMGKLPAEAVVPELRETLLTQLCTALMGAREFGTIVHLMSQPWVRVGTLTGSMHFMVGLAQMELKNIPEAAEHFRRCLKLRDRPTPSPINKEILKAAPNHCLALCFQSQKNSNAARRAFVSALKDDPESRPARFDFARFLAENKEPVEALKLLHQLVEDKADDVLAWKLGGNITLRDPQLHPFALEWTGEAVRYCTQDTAILQHRAQALMLNDAAGEACPWWEAAGTPTNETNLAAVILCALVARQPLPSFPENLEKPLSAEFINWYRRLLGANAKNTIHSINSQMAVLKSVLPTAADCLASALDEAGEPAVATE